tara:strand:+ start:361 stop:582 length:222 start_codon:yes stop_codon:yes gene_type:complete
MTEKEIMEHRLTDAINSLNDYVDLLENMVSVCDMEVHKFFNDKDIAKAEVQKQCRSYHIDTLFDARELINKIN